MRKWPAFQFYADDFLSGTMVMSDAEKGVYITMLCLQWTKGALGEREIRAAGDREAVEYVLEQKFEQGDDGKWRNTRLEHVRQTTEERSKAGSKGGSKTQANDQAKRQANGQAKFNPPTPTPTPTPTPVPEPIPTPKTAPQTPQGVTCDEFLERWNNFVAKRPKLKPVRKLTDKRRDKIRSRLRDPGWFDDFREAILSLPLPGDGWQPGIDWLTRNEHNIYLLLEGEFDWRGKDDPAAQRLAANRRKQAFDERAEREQKAKSERADRAEQDSLQKKLEIETFLKTVDAC